MDNNSVPTHRSWKSVLFYSLVCLLFFQLVSDFVESIYTFGLLGTNIPPEIVSVLLFFTPLILLVFRRRLPYRVALVLAGIAALAHPVEVMLDPKGKLLASGLGVGCLFVLLPVLLMHQKRPGKEHAGMEIGSGLALALAASILLRSFGAGSDLSLLQPWLSWLLALVLLAIIILLARSDTPVEVPAQKTPISFGATTALSLGCLGTLAVLYFGFASPTVLARWTALDYRLVVFLLSLALALYAVLFTGKAPIQLSKPLVLAWNALFLLAGTAAIYSNQVSFPSASSAYPLDQPALAIWQQIPFFLMLLLSPITLLDFSLITSELTDRQPAPRSLAGGFSIAALVFLVIILGQVFTTVYDYIPVVGPWFRDRFWLVFLIAGLGMALPVLAIRLAVRLNRSPRSAPMVGRITALGVSAALIVSLAWVILSQPLPPSVVESNGLRVLTYNIQQGYSADGRRNYAGQLELIRSLKPDLVGLQESDVARFSGGNADIVRTITEGLDMYVYYGPRTVTGTFGIALLSRYPIQNPRTFFMYSAAEQTAAIQAQISVNGKIYQILVTHLGNGGPLIQQQQVLERLVGLQNVIAMGDFNFDQTTEQYALTVQSLADAWVLVGSPPAAGLDMSHLIDHIFVSPGTNVQTAQYIASPASDHPALLAVFSP